MTIHPDQLCHLAFAASVLFVGVVGLVIGRNQCH